MDKTNRGAIWKNKKKEQDTHPDFTGQLNVDGVEYWVNAWKRKEDAPANAPALSFSIRPKEEQQRTMPAAKLSERGVSARKPIDDDLPF